MAKTKQTDEEQVAAHLAAMDAALLPQVNALRKIILKADSRIKERIKWNAPSYYHGQDMLTFGPRRGDKILLVFHHPSIVTIPSALLEGDYKDRRLAYFSSLKEIKQHAAELTRIVQHMVKAIDAVA